MARITVGLFIIGMIIASSSISAPAAFGGKIDSPRKQMASGVAAEDVVCRSDLTLIIRGGTGTAACVKPSSAIRLAGLGWGIIVEEDFSEPVGPAGGYLVEEVRGGIYRVSDNVYQMMFMITEEGVIVVDAPPNVGEKILDAISQVTDEPITHVIYSHSHKDHIGAAHIYPAGATVIAHEETASLLSRSNDPDRPIPTVTFSDEYTLSVGNQVLELSYKGAVHQRGNIFVYAPNQKVLMLVDHIHPGWVPWKALGMTEDVPAYIDAYDRILEYDFDIFLPGHGDLGDREEVLLQKQYIEDLQEKAMIAIQTVDYAEATKGVEPDGYKMTDAYFEALAQRCAKLSDEEWKDKLKGAGVWTDETCFSIIHSIFVD